MRDRTNWTHADPIVSRITPQATGEPAVSEQYELIRRVADDLAHELKNPLNAVVINLEVLRTRVRAGKAEAALERVDVIDAEVQRLHRLLDRLLRLLRPDRGSLDAYAVDGVLEEVAGIAEVLAKVGRKRFVLEPVGDDVYIRFPRESLRFAALILIEAGLRGVAEGGEVRLHGGSDRDRVWLHVDAADGARAGLQGAVESVRRLGQAAPVVAEAVVPGGCRVSLTVPRGG